MGLTDKNLRVDIDADALELGSMPPLPRPRAHPATRSPLSVVTSRSSNASPRSRDTPRPQETDDLDVAVSPAPVPHAHPLRDWKPQRQANVGAAMMEHMRRPVRSRHVDIERLDPTMLNRDRVVALASQGVTASSELPGLEIVPHSTRALQARIKQIENAQIEPRPLTEDELRFAATEASQLRQLGYDGMDPQNRRLITGPPAPQDSALERARQRKVKKQVDAKWLEKRNDPALRPLGPLEREDEKDFYDSVYVASLQELVDEGVLYDEQDLQSAMTVRRMEWNDMAVDRRGTTGLSGCCFDEWAFQ